MPSFATIKTDIHCPSCNSLLPGHFVGFQWGYCWVSLGTSISVYRVGEPLLWRLDQGGSVPIWSYFWGENGGNIGDPAYADLLIRESELFGPRCPNCTHGFIEVGIVIRGGVIQEVRAFENDVMECDVSLIGSDGKITLKPEWDECPMTIVEGGGGERLVPHTELLAQLR